MYVVKGTKKGPPQLPENRIIPEKVSGGWVMICAHIVTPPVQAYSPMLDDQLNNSSVYYLSINVSSRANKNIFDFIQQFFHEDD